MSQITISKERMDELLDALDTGIQALTALAKTGSLHREVREDALKRMWEARQERLTHG